MVGIGNGRRGGVEAGGWLLEDRRSLPLAVREDVVEKRASGGSIARREQIVEVVHGAATQKARSSHIDGPQQPSEQADGEVEATSLRTSQQSRLVLLERHGEVADLNSFGSQRPPECSFAQAVASLLAALFENGASDAEPIERFGSLPVIIAKLALPAFWFEIVEQGYCFGDVAHAGEDPRPVGGIAADLELAVERLSA